MTPAESKPYIQRAVRTQQIAVFTSLPPLIYLIGLFLDLSRDELLRSLLLLPPLVVVFTVARISAVSRIISRSMARDPGEADGVRLRRLLELPRRLEVSALSLSLLSCVIFTTT